MGAFAIIRSMIKKKDKSVNPGKVIIPTGHPKRPEEHEVDTAWVLARHYRTTVEFLVPVDDYKRTSPDVLMNGVIWEIKSPKGKSRYTIQEQFKRASKQAKNVIIDSRRTKLKDKDIVKSIDFEIQKRPYLKKIILIDKSKKVVAIKE